jgi:hypothetical protein
LFLAKKFAYHIHIAEKVDDLVSVAEPDPGYGAFLTAGSGMRKNSGSGSGMNNPDLISESLEKFIWVKKTKII